MSKELFVGQNGMQRKFIKDAKKGVSNFSVALPNINKKENGEWEFDGGVVLISTLQEFNDYVAGQQEIMDLLKENFPDVVSMIWKGTFSEFTGNAGSTIAGKLLNGEQIKTDKIMKSSDYYDVENTMYIILKALSSRNAGPVEKSDVLLIPYKKTNSKVMSLLQNDFGGYFLPVVTENGCVVDKTPNKKLGFRFFAIPESEVSYEQVVEYLSMLSPLDDDFEKADMIQDLVEQSKNAYRLIKNGSPSQAMHSVRVMTDYASILYRPDLSQLPGRKPKVAKPEIQDEEIKGFDESDFEQHVEILKPKGVKEIVVHGNTNTKTSIENGEIVATITPEEGLVFDVVVNDGKTVVKQFAENENQMKMF